MTDNFSGNISIERMVIDGLTNPEAAKQSHRHDRHSFFLLETGTIHIEIDFQKHIITSPSVIYMHPNQVHCTTIFGNVSVSSWAINNNNLNPEYLQLLEDITPVKPLLLDKETYAVISEAVLLCIKFSERKTDKLYNSLLKDSCNALVALVVSMYLAQVRSIDNPSRFNSVTKAFSKLLEQDYTIVKRPTDYARKLHLSTSYLNECVKDTTGYSVSRHIQHRIILQAKRLLRYSNKSVKEIATELGYADHAYFSRLFTKVAGMPAGTFRNKNLD